MAKGKKRKPEKPEETKQAEAATAPEELLAAVAAAEEVADAGPTTEDAEAPTADDQAASTATDADASTTNPLLIEVSAIEEAGLAEPPQAGNEGTSAAGEDAVVLQFGRAENDSEGTEGGQASAEAEAGEDGPQEGADAAASGAATTGDEENLGAVPTELLETVIESLLFVSDRPLSMNDLKRLLHERDSRLIGEAIASLQGKRESTGVRVVQTAGGWGLRTHPASAPWVTQVLKGRPVRLSRAMLETLAIVAYRQPVTRPEIDEVRGVDCGPVLKTLLDRDLVRVIGKKEDVGRPLLYGTSPEFLRVFSLRDLNELPTLREFHELSAENAARVAAKHAAATAAATSSAGAVSSEAGPVSSEAGAGSSESSGTAGGGGTASAENGPEIAPALAGSGGVTVAEAGPVQVPAPINRAPLLGDDGEEEDALLDELDRATAAATRVTEEAQMAAKPASDPGAEPQGESS